ncbi:MAG TPA: hypothetical protein PKX48_00175 [Planctomycetota bacterium]|nr:hypothetical protein [Planctomycetota bacterium]OQC20027.1 MAG: hypothetical protein BWX69_02183 [Planctomycetes bacterium ADurb.Bin069]HNR99559.1 hypothetical protein [Planctomycetota bacterium]HNU26505.1 hypothetical protein [Planctomycetota bacterium]HOE28417.1 hypothetical protein [Planctomycetota bacterium]
MKDVLARPRMSRLHAALGFALALALALALLMSLLGGEGRRNGFNCFLSAAAALPFALASGIAARRLRPGPGGRPFFRTKIVWAILLVLACLATIGPEFAPQAPPWWHFSLGAAICAALAFVLVRMGARIAAGKIGLPDEPGGSR